MRGECPAAGRTKPKRSIECVLGVSIRSMKVANFRHKLTQALRLIEQLSRHHMHYQAFPLQFAFDLEQADAERSLKSKKTKKAREDMRIATEKIERHLERLANLYRTKPSETDSQIFPKNYAPVILDESGKRWIRPMRYTCRLTGKPANYDVRYPGTYNARRDNLKGFWSDVYGQQHAILVVSSFFENVSSHVYEKRELVPGEKEKNIVLHFNPNPPQDMVIACLWSHWAGKDAPDLYSFAAVTDDPPPEIAATGHNRVIISIKEQNIDDWLQPGGNQGSPARTNPDRPRATLLRASHRRLTH